MKNTRIKMPWVPDHLCEPAIGRCGQRNKLRGLGHCYRETGSTAVCPCNARLHVSFVNLSIRTGQFPDNWKKALVKPIFKSGNSDDMVNYRPISLLPVHSKVLEKVVSEQFLHHLENNNLLHPLQFGFRHDYSTETATCLLLENIKRSLYKGLQVGTVFLDLKKGIWYCKS